MLVIDLQAMDAPEIPTDPPIAVEAVFERDLLNLVAQVRLGPLRRADLAVTIEAGARNAAEPAQMLDGDVALPPPLDFRSNANPGRERIFLSSAAPLISEARVLM